VVFFPLLRLNDPAFCWQSPGCQNVVVAAELFTRGATSCPRTMSTVFTEEQARAYMHKLLATMSQPADPISSLPATSREHEVAGRDEADDQPEAHARRDPDAGALADEREPAPEFAKEMECNFAISIPAVSALSRQRP
jgi:hypothetical protein